MGRWMHGWHTSPAGVVVLWTRVQRLHAAEEQISPLTKCRVDLSVNRVMYIEGLLYYWSAILVLGELSFLDWV